MNALESEYSFLAPTWKLPTVATPSMYSRIYGTSLLSDESELGLDWILWKNTLYNSRYAPPYTPPMTSHRHYSLPVPEQRIAPPAVSFHPMPSEHPQLARSLQSNDYPPYASGHYPNGHLSSSQMPESNRHATHPPKGSNQPLPSVPPKRRVQIIDPIRQTPSTAINDLPSGRNSYNSNQVPFDPPPPAPPRQHHRAPEMNKSQARSKPSVANSHPGENRYGYVENRYNLHEYLYGLSAPDPGSYVDAFRQHQRRLQDEKFTRRYVMSDYRNFAQNGGFGPTFGDKDYQAQKEKVNNHTRKKSYSKAVHETNQFRIEEQKRLQTNSSRQKHQPASIPKHQRAREYAEKIEKPAQAKPMTSAKSSIEPPIFLPIVVTSVPQIERRSSAGDLPVTEFDINQSRFSSSSYTLPSQSRRVRFHPRDFVRRRSSTFTEFPARNDLTYRLETCADCHKPVRVASDTPSQQPKKSVGRSQKPSRSKDKTRVHVRQAKTANGDSFTRKTKRSIPRPARHCSTKFKLEDYDFRRRRLPPRVENDSSHQ